MDKALEDYKELEEHRILATTLNSFRSYESQTKSHIVKPRRLRYGKLDDKYKELVAHFCVSQLDDIEDSIEENAFFLNQVANVAQKSYDIDEKEYGFSWEDCSATDVEKIQSTFRQICREWSTDGQLERLQSYGRVLRELEAMYPDRTQRHAIRVLVPGCGLGRLPLELAAMGFQAQGNEFSYHMLFTSGFILNHTSTTNEYAIHPYLHTFSHHRTRQHQTKRVLIPDLSPRVLVQHHMNDETIPPEGLLSMTVGSFDEVYPIASDDADMPGGQFDVITTVFFLDTAPNIFKTLQAISDTIVQGGAWINFGPLLWHYEDQVPDAVSPMASDGEDEQDISNNNKPDLETRMKNIKSQDEEDRSMGFEFAMEDLINLIPHFGFEIIRRESDIPCQYTVGIDSMGGYVYSCEYWVATKK